MSPVFRPNCWLNCRSVKILKLAFLCLLAMTSLIAFQTFSVMLQTCTDRIASRVQQTNVKDGRHNITAITFGRHYSSAEISTERNVQSRYYDARKVKDLQKSNSLFQQQLTSKENIISFLLQPIIQRFNYSFLHNPESACENEKTEVLNLVPFAPQNFANKIKVRNRYNDNKLKIIAKVALLFFFGRPGRGKDNAGIQRRLNAEVRKHGDIVKIDYPDDYKSIRTKAVTMLRWASTYCRHASYVIRTDDDVKANISDILEVLQATQRRVPDFVLGVLKKNWTPYRNSTSK